MRAVHEALSPQPTFAIISHSKLLSSQRTIIWVVRVGDNEDFFAHLLNLIHYANTATIVANLAMTKVIFFTINHM